MTIGHARKTPWLLTGVVRVLFLSNALKNLPFCDFSMANELNWLRSAEFFNGSFMEKKSNYYLEINKTVNFGDFTIDFINLKP